MKIEKYYLQVLSYASVDPALDNMILDLCVVFNCQVRNVSFI